MIRNQILNGMIDTLELKIRETKFQILLKCKDFRIYLIDFPSIYHCQGVFKSLDALSNISKNSLPLKNKNRLFLIFLNTKY